MAFARFSKKNYLVVILLLPLLLIVSEKWNVGDMTAYGTQTPYGEWDFDIIDERFTVTHSSVNPKIMNISIPVTFMGEFPTGKVNVYAVVTNPTGSEHNMFASTRNLGIGQTQVTNFAYTMTQDGLHHVRVYITAPSNPYLDWVFDEAEKTLSIAPNGLLKKYDTQGDRNGTLISYFLGIPSEVKYNEAVHVKINLPENHNIEKVVITNKKVVKIYDANVKDVYLISPSMQYPNMKIKLVEYGNILPLADAQENLQDYVVFYAIDKKECSGVVCVNIDQSEEDFPYWLLLLAGFGIIPVLLRKKTTRTSWQKPYEEF